VADPHQPGKAIQCRPEDVSVTDLDAARVDGGADRDSHPGRPLGAKESPLGRNGGGDRRFRSVEAREHPVAGALHNGSAGLLDGAAKQLVVDLQGAGHLVPMVLPEATAALDVGEQERRGPRLHPRHCATIRRETAGAARKFRFPARGSGHANRTRSPDRAPWGDQKVGRVEFRERFGGDRRLGLRRPSWRNARHSRGDAPAETGQQRPATARQ
jgi:hypothetical protein